MLDRRSFLFAAGFALTNGKLPGALADENPGFDGVTAAAYAAAIRDAKASATFESEYLRYRPSSYDGWNGPDFKVRRGDLNVAGNWKAPGFQTLLIGNLTVSGLVDLANPYDAGFDEGAQCIIVGNVKCYAFANQSGKVTMIDGDLIADEVIINGYEDASLTVIGNLRTAYFQGEDIWAEVGGRARMEYGDGYCLPLHYTNAVRQKINPRFGPTESKKALNKSLDPESPDLAGDMLKLVRNGSTIFKTI